MLYCRQSTNDASIPFHSILNCNLGRRKDFHVLLLRNSTLTKLAIRMIRLNAPTRREGGDEQEDVKDLIISSGDLNCTRAAI